MLTPWQEFIDEVVEKTLQRQPLFAITGAGMSVASGIPDFRSPGGLWERYDPFDYASMSSFFQDPARVWEMLRELYAVVGQHPANPGHHALARLEQAGLLEGIITQNIDHLHQEAGSQNVVEYHGNGKILRCLTCKQTYPSESMVAITPDPEAFDPPRCTVCERILKPNAIFFGEEIPTQALDESQRLLDACDILWVIGTSGEVAPANMIPLQAAVKGALVIEINTQPTRLTRQGAISLGLYGPQEEILPVLAEKILAASSTH